MANAKTKVAPSEELIKAQMTILKHCDIETYVLFKLMIDRMSNDKE